MLNWKPFSILTVLILLGDTCYYLFLWYVPHAIPPIVLNFPLVLILSLLNILCIVLVLFSLFSNKTPPTNATYTDEMLMQSLPSLSCIKDGHYRWIAASDDYLASLNLLNADYQNMTDEQLLLMASEHATELRANIEQDRQAWQLKKPVTTIRTLTPLNAEPISIELTSTPIFDTEEQPLRLLISTRPLQSLQNNAEYRLLNALFEDSHTSFAILDEKFNIKRINHRFSDLSGYMISDIKNQPIASLNKKHTDKLSSELRTFFKQNDDSYSSWSKDIVCKTQYDKNFIAQLEITQLPTEPQQYLASLINITLHKQHEKRILRMDHYDDLTGLANRDLYLEHLSQFTSHAVEHKQHAIICFINLDLFKSVNDIFGHNAGDEIIKETAKRLRSLIQKNDIIARFSGDEFALLIRNESSHEKAIFSATMMAEKILKTLSAKFTIHHHEIMLTASIGISIFPENGLNAETLVKNADLAIYQAKKNGRNNSQFYKQSLSLAHEERLLLENQLRKALSLHELHLYYQPQYHAKTQKLWGAEVLIRWIQDPHGAKKMISPELFIPIAEETGIIVEIGTWILETACLQLKKWLKAGYPLQQVSVNVSARQFMNENFLHSVENALSKSGLHPKHLEIEITETMLVGDAKIIELKLNRLKNMGIKIALDDFGTGYSSLSYLKNFPVDMIKIDQSFVKGMTTQHSKDAKLIKTIINMGHSLDQHVIAEGVENEAQLRFLCQNQCDIIQGYYFSKPLPDYKMATLLQSERHV